MATKTTTKAEAEAAPVGPPPAHAGELCGECGVHALDPSTTSFSCEHGTWSFAAVAPEPEPTEDERRAAVIASLDADTLRALLAEKTQG